MWIIGYTVLHIKSENINIISDNIRHCNGFRQLIHNHYTLWVNLFHNTRYVYKLSINVVDNEKCRMNLSTVSTKRLTRLCSEVGLDVDEICEIPKLLD